MGELAMNDAADGVQAGRLNDLEKEVEKYRALAYFAQDALASCSDGRVATWNLAAERMFGHKAADALGKAPEDLVVSGPDRENWARAVSGLFADNPGTFTSLNVEFVARRADGREFHAEAALSLVKVRDGWNVVAVFRDITSRKEAELAISLEKERLEAEKRELISRQREMDLLFKNVVNAKKEWEGSFDSMQDLVILTDEKGIIKRCNRAVTEFTGMPFTQILGRDWEQLLNEHKLESEVPIVPGVELFHRPKGRWFIFNSYVYVDPVSGENSGMIITIHDSTQLRKILLELQSKNAEIEENKRKLQEALDKISALIQQVVFEKHFGVRFDNPHIPTCHEYFGCGKTACPCHGKTMPRCWQTVGSYCGFMVKNDFSDRYNKCAECPVFRQATADPIYLIGEHFNNMMHILDLKNSELEKAYEDLKATQAQILQQEKMASIGQLAAGVAHEINNPMGFISSNLGTLGRYVDRLSEFMAAQTEALRAANASGALMGLAEKRRSLKIDYIEGDIKNLVGESLDGAERVRKIVHDLKGFSRVDEGECKPANINECLDSTINIVWSELKYRCTLVKDYGDIPPVRCYAQQINQVFMNLLVNAAHAIEKQGEISIKTWEGDGAVCISISDTGCGMPEKVVNKIFEPFFTTKEVGKGTGLGLSITYDIIKKHDGEILVDSEAGKGTTFTVKLPVRE